MRIFFITLSLLFASLSVDAQTSYSRYDVNNDHEVNVTDVTKLVNIILGTDTGSRGDVNGDEAVNVNDVTALVDFILGKRMINGHEFVDLGLPSGTLWATQNMGANTPEQAGDYYAWGELEPKDTYTWTNYALCGGTSKTLNRYNTNPSYGVVDNVSRLSLDDDAAYNQWQGLWRIPSVEQTRELKSLCTWTLDQTKGVFTVKGPNGNSILIPLAGYKKGSAVTMKGTSGYYWTSALTTESPTYAYALLCDQSMFEMNALRYCGRTIRPVAK